MDAVSAVSSSAQALNQILMMANAKTIEQAEKLMKYTVETALASQPGMGENIDVYA